MRKYKFSRKQLSVPYALFMLFFIVLPLFIIVYYAFTDKEGNVSLNNFIAFFSDVDRLYTFGISLAIGTINTVLCLLIGYPIAMILSNKKYNRNATIVLLFIMPMWINFVLRTAATRDLLYMLGIDGGKTPYLTTMIGMVYNFLPFTILPLYTTMLKMDKNLIEASYDLGARPTRTFVNMIIPMTMPGIISAATMVFMPTMSSYVISDLLGEGKVQLIGNIISLNFDYNQWQAGSFTALVMLMIIGISMLFTRNVKTIDNVRGSIW